MSALMVLNGPNLNLLGQRNPDAYGTSTLANVESLCAESCYRLGLDLTFRQTNHEGVLIDWIHDAGSPDASPGLIGVVLNAGAWTHTSIAIRDAIEAIELPVVEVHISNVHRREEFRHHSYVSSVASGIVIGFGVVGYALAIEGLHALWQSRKG